MGEGLACGHMKLISCQLDNPNSPNLIREREREIQDTPERPNYPCKSLTICWYSVLFFGRMMGSFVSWGNAYKWLPVSSS